MTDTEISGLLVKIQNAIDNRDIEAVLRFYHPEVVYVGAVYPTPIKGIEALRSAYSDNFKGPQKTSIKFSKIGITRITAEVFAVYCQIEGRQTIYFSSREFKGWLSRIFLIVDNDPKIIHEHFTIIS